MNTTQKIMSRKTRTVIVKNMHEAELLAIAAKVRVLSIEPLGEAAEKEILGLMKDGIVEGWWTHDGRYALTVETEEAARVLRREKKYLVSQKA